MAGSFGARAFARVGGGGEECAEGGGAAKHGARGLENLKAAAGVEGQEQRG